MTKLIAGLLFASSVMLAAPSDAVYVAIRANQLGTLESLLKQPGGANSADDRGITPLMNAAVAGSAEAMKLILDHGANPKARNAFGSTALMWSVTDPGKVRLLLDRGADVNAVSKQGRTALLIAALSDDSAPIVRSWEI